MTNKTNKNESFLDVSFKPLKKKLLAIAFFSFFINLLILAPSWYMLEVYDRVINSRNTFTLVMLTLMVVIFYLILELIEWVRLSILHKVSTDFNQCLREKVFDTIFFAKLRQMPGAGTQAFNDVKTIQNFIVSPAFLAIIDIPYSMVTIAILFYMNFILGCFAAFGLLFLIFLGLMSQRKIQPILAESNRAAIEAQNYVSGLAQNAEVIDSMGLANRIHSRWHEKQIQSVTSQAIASDRAAINSSFSKFMINMQSSFLLGLAAWLTLQGDLSPALIFIGSMLGGRALTPVVLATTHLRSVVNVQDAKARLENFFTLKLPEKTHMKLPEPKGNLLLTNVIAGPPGEDKQVLKGVSLKLTQGQSLAIIGPSASGKSTLAKVISGVWPSMKGEVRLDGADIFSWNKLELGPYIGYLPQNVELFDGTIARNIARFGEVDLLKLNEVIELVGLTEFIKNLPDGLDTQLGFEGSFLSGGQRQRIGLSRALYDKPKLVILDEPNSNLDEAGEDALIKAIQAIKLNGSTVIVVTHRPRLLSCLDMTLILIDGVVKTFGPTQEVLESLKRSNSSSNQNQIPSNQTTPRTS